MGVRGAYNKRCSVAAHFSLRRLCALGDLQWGPHCIIAPIHLRPTLREAACCRLAHQNGQDEIKGGLTEASHLRTEGGTSPYHTHTIPHYTTLYHTIPRHTIPHHTIPYHAMPYRAMLYHTTALNTIPHYTIPSHPMPCHAMPCHTTPHHTVPYHTVPYRTMSCHAIQ